MYIYFFVYVCLFKKINYVNEKYNSRRKIKKKKFQGNSHFLLFFISILPCTSHTSLKSLVLWPNVIEKFQIHIDFKLSGDFKPFSNIFYKKLYNFLNI